VTAVLHDYVAVTGLLAVVVAMTYARLQRVPLSPPLLALAVGVLLGPEVLGVLGLSEEQRPHLLAETTRFLLAVSVMGVALRYSINDARRRAGSVLVLLVVIMPVMAGVTAGLAGWLLGLPAAAAWLLGAALSPTDPVLATSVVTGEPAERTLPSRLRQVLSLESGANDGLALPLVLVGLALVKAEGFGAGLARGGYQVGVAIVLGVAIGLAAGKAIGIAERHRQLDAGTRLVFAAVLALATLGCARVISSDGILAVFVAGLAYNAVTTGAETEGQEQIDDAMNRFLVLPIFVVFGVALPWQEWVTLGWPALGFAVAVLLLRRIPAVAALARPLHLAPPGAAYLAWFGPIGVSALFYLVLAEEEGAGIPELWTAGSLVVAISVVAYGVTGAPGRQLYGRWAAARGD
jgi:NhaP-type Na+/H+ or K+/H+ antiporter